MTVRMKARRSFPYAGKRFKAGQEFNARGETDARVLAAVGHAERVTAPAPTPAPTPAPRAYLTRAIAAAPVQVVMRAAPPAPEPVQSAEPAVEPVADAAPDLEAMDRDELHALAVARGVKVHHLAGAAKVRAAIIEAAQ